MLVWFRSVENRKRTPMWDSGDGMQNQWVDLLRNSQSKHKTRTSDELALNNQN